MGVIRQIRVSRPLIDEVFRYGEKEAVTLSRGIPDDYQVFNATMTEFEVVFWFARKTEGGSEMYRIDDTPPVLTRKDP